MDEKGNYKLLWFGMGNANTTSCSVAREMLLAYKNKSILCVDNIAEPSRFISVTVAEADGFRLYGRNHKLIFEQNKFSHARKQVCGYTNKTCHIIIFEYVNMTTT